MHGGLDVEVGMIEAASHQRDRDCGHLRFLSHGYVRPATMTGLLSLPGLVQAGTGLVKNPAFFVSAQNGAGTGRILPAALGGSFSLSGLVYFPVTIIPDTLNLSAAHCVMRRRARMVGAQVCRLGAPDGTVPGACTFPVPERQAVARRFEPGNSRQEPVP